MKAAYGTSYPPNFDKLIRTVKQITKKVGNVSECFVAKVIRGTAKYSHKRVQKMYAEYLRNPYELENHPNNKSMVEGWRGALNK